MRTLITTAAVLLGLGAGSAQAALFCGAGGYNCCPTTCCAPGACYTSCRVERQTCYRTVYETCYQPEQYEVCRTVYDTVCEEVAQTCYRDVVEQACREEQYTVQRPVHETVYREHQYQVQRPVCSICRSGCRTCPDAITIWAPPEVAILPASILVFMPPRENSEPAAPAMFSISAVMRSTTGMCRAEGSRAGGAVYRPSMSDSKTRRSALAMVATRAARRSLSP